MAERIGSYMAEKGMKFLRPTVPENIELLEDGRKRVTWTLEGQQQSDVFDTVLSATGRTADTSKLNLYSTGVKLDKSGKILCTKDDRSSVENIFAIGDVVLGRPELTPVAIKGG